MPALFEKNPLTIAVAGSSGLIGTALCDYLEAQGYSVKRLVRQRPIRNSTKEIYWNPDSGHIERQGLDGCHVVIHLGGKSLNGIWTRKRKRAIVESRVKSTKLLSHAISRLKRPPFLFICASATGYYGNRDDEILSEESKPGLGFLASLCREWEDACGAAEKSGIRVIHLRSGVVLSNEGGLLSKFAPLFRMGLGGFIDNGQQYLSWISLADVVKALEHLMSNPTFEGPVNLVAPNPVIHKEFCMTLADALHRPCAISVSPGVVRFLLGDMGKELLLSSTRVEPRKLLASNYEFTHPTLSDAFSFFWPPKSK